MGWWFYHNRIKGKDYATEREGLYEWHDDVEVETVDLSQWIKDNFSKEDFIVMKMDIEGAEYTVLPKLIEDGTASYINRAFIEWHDWVMGGYSNKTAELQNQLKQNGVCSGVVLMKIEVGNYELDCDIDPRIQNNASDETIVIEDVGFIFNCVFKQKAALEYSVGSIKKVYPDSKVYVVSDGGFDYSYMEDDNVSVPWRKIQYHI